MPNPFPPDDIVRLLELAAGSAGLAAVASRFVKLWIESRKAQRIKLKKGDFEMEIEASANECDYSVRWSEEEGVYVGRVAEFPSLTAQGETPAAALAEIKFVVEAMLEDSSDEKGGKK